MGDRSFCRLCAFKKENYINIFEEEGRKLNLSSKITQCLQIWLYPEDILPKTVCSECCLKLNQCFDFFELCSQSQLTLMAIFDDKKTVTDSNQGEQFKILPVSKESEDSEEYEDDGDDGNDTEYNVECVLSEKKSTSRRKLRTPIKIGLNENQMEESENGIKTNEKKSSAVNLNERRSKRCSANNMALLEPAQLWSSSSSSSSPSSPVLTELTTKEEKLMMEKQEEKNERFEDDDNECEDEEEDEFVQEKKTAGRRLLDMSSWKCTDCSADLPSLSLLKEHHKVQHQQAPNFKCPSCSKVYTRYRSFARHIKLHGSPKKFSCEVCGKSFSQKTVLQSHSTVHSEERPHICQQCGKAFKQFSSLYLHSKCHLPEQSKPKFPCSVCLKQFTTKHTLEQHMKIHTGERNFVCDICGKSFIAKGSLDYHILTHNDVKPHCCSVCGKGFKTVRLLTKHSTLHTGIKPHQCDVCGKQFRERGALKEHNRIHTGAMPYSCEFCGKLFRFKGILTVHRRQHTGERPYSCTECHRHFTNWANYNKHMKRRHRNPENQNAPRIILRSDLQTEHPQQVPQPIPQHATPSHVISIASPHSVQIPAVSNGMQLQMQSPPMYMDHTNESGYKLMHENSDTSNLYHRVPTYVSPHTMTGMGYCVPQMHHQAVLHTRNQ